MRLLKFAAFICSLYCFISTASDLQDRGDEFNALLINNSPYKDINDFLLANKDDVNTIWHKGSFLQILMPHDNFLAFSALVKLEPKYASEDFSDVQKKSFLSQAIKERNYKATYYLIGNGDFDSPNILQYLYDQLLSNYLKPKMVVNLALSIIKYIELYKKKNYEILKEFKLDKSAENNINSIISSIISTDNLPTEKSFLLPIINVFLSVLWDYENFPQIFTNISKMQSPKLAFAIEKLLIDFEQNFDIYIDIPNISIGVLRHLEFNKRYKYKNSEPFQRVVEKMIERLSQGSLMNKYFCLRIIQVYNNGNNDKIEKIKEDLFLMIKDLNNTSLENKICLFTSILYLPNFKISIKKYYREICTLYYDITLTNKEESLNINNILSDVLFWGILDFNKYNDVPNFALEKAKILLFSKYLNNSQKISSIKILMEESLEKSLKEDKHRAKWKQKIGASIEKLTKETKNISASSIDMLNDICSKLDIKCFIKQEDKDLIKKSSSKEILFSITDENSYPDINMIREVFLNNKVLRSYCSKKGFDLAQFCTIKTYLKDEIIFNKKDKEKGAYVVISGEIAQTIKDKKIKTVKNPDFLGESSLFSNASRTYTAIATCDSKLIEINCEKMLRQAKRDPDLLALWIIYFRDLVLSGNDLIEKKSENNYKDEIAKYEVISIDMDYRNDLINSLVSSQEQYQNKPFNIIAKIISKKRKDVKIIKYEPGIIRSKGENCTSIIFILDGTLEAKIGDVVLKKYSQWDILGDLNVFQKNPQTTAEVISVPDDNSNCTVLHIPIELFEKKVKKNYLYQINLIKTIIRMIRQNNRYNYSR